MRALAALALAVVLTAGAGTALGHSDVVATAPRDGARLKAAPRAVTVTYASPLAAAVEATVRAPGGSARPVKPRLDARNARRVIVPVRGRGPGRYRASWTVLGTDGHELAGSASFVVRAPGDRRRGPRAGRARATRRPGPRRRAEGRRRSEVAERVHRARR